MMWKRIVVGVIVVVGLSGCSGVSPVQLGQTAGTLVGTAIAPGIGAPIGTLVGTLAGLVIEDHVDKMREQKERVDLSKELKGRPLVPGAAASATRPLGQPTRVWVDERLDQGRLIPGHFDMQPVP